MRFSSLPQHKCHMSACCRWHRQSRLHFDNQARDIFAVVVEGCSPQSIARYLVLKNDCFFSAARSAQEETNGEISFFQLRERRQSLHLSLRYPSSFPKQPTAISWKLTVCCRGATFGQQNPPQLCSCYKTR